MAALHRIPHLRRALARVHFFTGKLLGRNDFESEQRYAGERVEVDEGRGFERWRRVGDLAGAGPDERVYALDPATGGIRFGDGVAGRRPPTGAAIRATYRLGAGDNEDGGEDEDSSGDGEGAA